MRFIEALRIKFRQSIICYDSGKSLISLDFLVTQLRKSSECLAWFTLTTQAQTINNNHFIFFPKQKFSLI